MEHLYIGLVNTPGLFATIIRRYLKIPYVHVVLGLDEKMEEAYSVGRRFINVPVIAGFEKENLSKIERKYPQADYKILRLECTAEQKKRIKEELEDAYEKRYQIHYAIIGLLFLVMQKEFYQKNYHTCASYLSYLLEKYEVLDFHKHFSLVTPKDFYNLSDLQVVFEGKIGELEREQYEEKSVQCYPAYAAGRHHMLGPISG